MSGIFENLGIDSGIIIIILLILTIFLLVRNISMNMRLSRLERKYKTFMKGSDAQSLEKMHLSLCQDRFFFLPLIILPVEHFLCQKPVAFCSC